MDEDVKPMRLGHEPNVPDPDNPPLTGKEVWSRWGDRLNAKFKAYDAKFAARKIKPQTEKRGYKVETKT